MPKPNKTFDQTLAEDSSLQSAWFELRDRLCDMVNSGQFLLRLAHQQIDHGPKHWDAVRKACEDLWNSVCKTNPKWWTPQSAYLLSAAAYLHDVSMVYGYHLIDPRAEPSHIKDKLEEVAAGTAVQLTHALAASPIGQLLIRQKQEELAERVATEWAEDGPLSNIDTPLLQNLVFVLKHYTRIKPELQQGQRELDPNHGDRLLAMAAVLQFADWSHLDRSRVDQPELAKATELASDFLQRLAGEPDVRIDATGELPCILPKFYRSHYVFGRHLDAGATNQVRFSVELFSPPGLREPEIDPRVPHDADMRLRTEWRAHMLPTRMHRPLAVDHLREFAQIELIYYEPRFGIPPGELHFCEVPVFVRDFWIAGRWFNLDEAAQALLSQQPQRMFDAMTDKVHPDMLYSQFDVRRGPVPADRPHLSRRVFLHLHINLTLGRSLVSQPFFHHFHHAMCCVHESANKVYQCALSAAKHVQSLLWQQYKEKLAGVLTEDEERIVAEIGVLCFRGPCDKNRLIGALTNEYRKAPYDEDSVTDVLETLVGRDALHADASTVQIASGTPGGALLAVSGAPFWTAWNT